MSYFSSGRIVAKVAARITAGVVLAALIAVNCPVVSNGAVISKPEIDRHNYGLSYHWSTPLQSYIVPLDNGGYMTFYYMNNIEDDVFDSEDGYIVEYFDSSFKCTERKRIPVELPLFGAFYSDSNNYYVFSGRDNTKESNSFECFRLTKYDKDWQRLGECSFSNCDTYHPFACGGADIATYGNIMAIRSNRTMYAGSDGLHHQANITMLVDSSTMKVKKALHTGFVGYFSHSFDQYVRIDNGHMVTCDHGDCYPREIGVQYFKDDVNSGETDKVDYYTALKIGGSYSDNHNYTGASLGGFEISSTSYIVAGSSIDQEKFDPNTPRNIYVSTVNKSTGEVKTKWITNLDDVDDDGYGTPWLVKISDNSFALIWSKEEGDGNVYYAFLDGNGNLKGSVLTAKGYIADCQPVLSGNKIFWFANEYNYAVQYYFEEGYLDYETIFYSIDVSDKSFHSKTVYEADVSNAKNGKATLSGFMFPEGEEVTVNLAPDEGYELSYILVNGKRITGNKFTMPDEPVDVTVNFKRIGSPNLDDIVNVGDYSYQVTNSDTEGAGTVMLTGVVNPVEAVVVPATVDINGYIYKVNRIGGTAFFEDQTVKTVYLNANVAVIDKNAFFGCPELVKVSGGAGLKTIGDNAFARCPKLSSFIITSKVLYKIGAQAFYKDAKLKTIYIKNTTKLTKGGVKKSLKGSSVKTVKVKKSKIWKYKKFFKKSNSGKKVKVKK